MSMYGGIWKLYKVSGKKVNTLMWLRMAGYRKYISSTYVFISSFVSLSKYAGRKLSTLMWICMAGEFMSIYIFGYALISQIWLRIAVYLNYLSSTYVFISSFVSLTKYVGRKLSARENSCLHLFTCTVIWLMSYLLTANNRQRFL